MNLPAVNLSTFFFFSVHYCEPASWYVPPAPMENEMKSYTLVGIEFVENGGPEFGFPDLGDLHL